MRLFGVADIAELLQGRRDCERLRHDHVGLWVVVVVASFVGGGQGGPAGIWESDDHSPEQQRGKPDRLCASGQPLRGGVASGTVRQRHCADGVAPILGLRQEELEGWAPPRSPFSCILASEAGRRLPP